MFSSCCAGSFSWLFPQDQINIAQDFFCAFSYEIFFTAARQHPDGTGLAVAGALPALGHLYW